MYSVVSSAGKAHIEMSQAIFDMALRLAHYIDANFDATDFFTVGRATQEQLADLLLKLQKAKAETSPDSSSMSITFYPQQYDVFQSVFRVASMFFDDMEGFSEEEYDSICEMHSLIDT